MKKLFLITAFGSLVSFSPLTIACPAGHHAAHGGMGMGMSEMDRNSDGAIDKQEFDAFHQQRFQALDANHDGKISQDELAVPAGCDVKTGKHPFADRFDETDINHDGALSRDEAEIGMPMLFAHFDEIDTNKDGKISKVETTAYMKKLHPQGKPAMQRKN